MNRFWLAVRLSAVLFLPAALAAAGSKPGRGAGVFLRVPVGARAVAMGESFSAAADDAQSLFWNPAGLAPLRTPQLHTGHLFYFGETRLDSLAAAYPTLWGGVAAGTRWFTGGGIPRLRDGVELGNFKSVERTGEAAIAFGKRNFSIGVLGKYYQHRIDEKNISAVLADVGLLKGWRKGRYRIGVAAQNQGAKFGFSSSPDLKAPPPRQWRTGFAFRPDPSFLFTLEHVLPQHRVGETHAGLEYWLAPPLAVRFGYLWLPRTEYAVLDPLANWRFGTGLRLGPVDLDYAYAPGHALGDVHHASLGIRFLALTELEEAGRLSLQAQPAYFSPNGDRRRDAAYFILGTEGVEGITKWLIEIRNAQSKRVRRFTGRGSAPGLTEWDGTAGGNAPAEGEYLVQGRVWGRASQALSEPVRVRLDVTPPQLTVAASTSVFSPDGDGTDDEVTFSLQAQDKNPLSHWTMTVRPAAEAERAVFSSSGTFQNGLSSFTWTGLSDLTREPAANGVYECLFTAFDAAENAGTAVVPVEVAAGAESILEKFLTELNGKRTEEGFRIVVPSEALFAGPAGTQIAAEESLPLRTKIVGLAQAFPAYRIVIDGYAGSERTRGQRTDLSSGQVWALYSALVKGGLPALRLQVHGRGGKRGEPNRLELLFVRPPEAAPSAGDSAPAEEEPLSEGPKGAPASPKTPAAAPETAPSGTPEPAAEPKATEDAPPPAGDLLPAEPEPAPEPAQ